MQNSLIGGVINECTGTRKLAGIYKIYKSQLSKLKEMFSTFFAFLKNLNFKELVPKILSCFFIGCTRGILMPILVLC